MALSLRRPPYVRSLVSRLEHWLAPHVIRRVKVPDEFYVVPDRMQASTLFAVIPSYGLWREESTLTKVRTLLAGRWEPKVEELEQVGAETLLRCVFGDESNFGPQLYNLTRVLAAREWGTDSLPVNVKSRAEALQATTVAAQCRLELPYWSSRPLPARA